MKINAILLLIAYLLVVLHGLIPHHHHGDMLVGNDIAHVHDSGSDHCHSHENVSEKILLFGDRIAANGVPHSHRHNHFHLLSNGFAHVERICSELEYGGFNDLSIPLFILLFNEEGRYYCRDDCEDFDERVSYCSNRLFNNVSPLRGPPCVL